MNGVQTRFKCKLDVKRCKRFVFPPSSLLPRSNALKTKAIRYFQTDRTLTRIVSPPLDDSMHPRSSRDFFERFCADQHLGCEVVSDIEGLQVRRGEVYIAIRQIDVVSIIKKSRVEGLQCGIDFGLIGYNDTPAYEVIDQGITALSVDWEKMGDKAAEFVLQGKTIQDYLPTEVRLRASL